MIEIASKSKQQKSPFKGNHTENRWVIISLFLLLSFSVKSFGQSRAVQNLPYYDDTRLHYGFILAINQMNFNVKAKDNIAYNTYHYDPVLAPDLPAYDSLNVYGVYSEPILGFTVGIVGNLRINEYLDLRLVPSLSLGERIIKYDLLLHNGTGDDKSRIVTVKKRIPSVLIDVPLHLKYKSKRYGNLRAYVMGGPRISFDLASQAKAQRLNNNASPAIAKQDVMMEVGFGFDFYTNYFKFGTEIKMGYGLFNILDRVVPENDNPNNIELLYTDAIEKVNSKIFQISFTFE